MSDEGLDNLFRKGLAERDVKFNMESWRRMEQMLPPEPKTKSFRFGYAAAFIGLLLTVSASLFVWNNQSAEITTGDSSYSASVNAEDDAQTGTSVLNAKEDMVVKNEETSVPESNNNTQDGVVSGEDNSSQGPQYSGSANVRSIGTSMSLNNLTSTSTSNANNSGLFNTGLFASKKEKFQTEEEIAFQSNAFTRISGLNEMATLSLVEEEDNITFIANVDNKNRPSADVNRLGFIGGVNVNPSLVSGSNGINGSEFLGIEYQRYLNGGLSVKADLLYSSRNEINTRKVYDMKYYDFGSSTEQTMVESQRLLYLELPVLANYNLGNHNIMFGPSVSYLFNGMSKVTTHHETISDSYSEEAMEWGTTTGFKSYDFALVAGYEYSLQERLNVGVRLNYGLIDVTDNNYFGNNSYDNNVQLRLYLTFSPFQF